MYLLVATFKFCLLLQFCWAFPEKDQLSVEIQEPKVKDVAYVPEETYKNDSNLLNNGLLKNEEVLAPQGKISYAGNQLWKVNIDDESKRKVIAELRDKQGKIRV